MRGKATVLDNPVKSVGITPAYAGKSSQPTRFSISHRDHPRVCGEKHAHAAMRARCLGSPPRMRGKVLSAGLHNLVDRITPAYAGKRSIWGQAYELQRDHPRVCGEKTGAPWRWLMVTGSPPRMRGKVVCLKGRRSEAGITPAYAGKSRAFRTLCVCGWDHPRVCGEKQRPPAHQQRRCGSPPRMRGKGTAGNHGTRNHRITPAYAGKSVCFSFGRSGRADHPRVCGEKENKQQDRTIT